MDISTHTQTVDRFVYCARTAYLDYMVDTLAAGKFEDLLVPVRGVGVIDGVFCAEFLGPL